MTINQLINKLAGKYRILYVGGKELFFFVVEEDKHLKEILTRYAAMYNTVQISGNGYGTGIQVMLK